MSGPRFVAGGRALRFFLRLAFCVAGAVQACAQTMTDVGTPRAETLIVEHLNGRIGNPTQMNFYQEGLQTGEGLRQIAYSQLWDIDTSTGKQFPALASTMPQPLNSEFTKFRFSVRQGMAWSDGVPFTAEDVVFTINMILGNPKIPYNAYLTTVVKSASKVDDYTVELETVKPYPRLTEALGSVIVSSGFWVMPEHIWKSVDPVTFQNFPPVTIGAYKYKAHDPNGFWVLWERREDWQKTDASILQGEPKPKYVLFRAFGPDEKRVIAMVQNDVDILTDVSPESWDLIREKNPEARVWMDRFPWANMNDPCQRGIAFNDSTPPYDRKEVRWALALATNIEAVSMSTFSGMLRVSPIMIPPIQVIMDNYQKPMVPLLMALKLDDGYAPFDPDVAIRMAERLRKNGIDNIPADAQAARDLFGVGWWKYDVAEAAKLLQSAGFTRGAANRWMLPDGTPWKMTINAPNNFEIESQRLAFAVANEWRRFGIDVSVQQLEGGAFVSANATGNFQVGSYWPSCAIGVNVFPRMEYWHKRNVRPTGTPASVNRERYSDDAVSAALDKLSTITSDDPRNLEYSTELMQAFLKGMPFIHMVGTSKFVPVSQHYWTNYPTAANYYEGPWWWWANFKYILPHFKPTGVN
jgi:peptide/nickel transport system substrate-binding protein